MEQPLPRPLDAEIVDGVGGVACISLVAYLGESRWRGVQGDGVPIIVEAKQILNLNAAAHD